MVANIGLVVVFAVQHSVMARPAFKAWWTKIIPAECERETGLRHHAREPPDLAPLLVPNDDEWYARHAHTSVHLRLAVVGDLDEFGLQRLEMRPHDVAPRARRIAEEDHCAVEPGEVESGTDRPPPFATMGPEGDEARDRQRGDRDEHPRITHR